MKRTAQISARDPHVKWFVPFSPSPRRPLARPLVLLQPLERLEAVEVGHHHVKDDQIDRLALEGGQCFQTVNGAERAITAKFAFEDTAALGLDADFDQVAAQIEEQECAAGSQ